MAGLEPVMLGMSRLLAIMGMVRVGGNATGVAAHARSCANPSTVKNLFEVHFQHSRGSESEPFGHAVICDV